MLKIPREMRGVQTEIGVAAALGRSGELAAHHLVGPLELVSFQKGSVVEAGGEFRSTRAGILMPTYASTMVCACACVRACVHMRGCVPVRTSFRVIGLFGIALAAAEAPLA